MKLRVKRAYDEYKKADGTRVLVDRLWPRGVRKADAHIDIWAKELAPSNALRTWFHKDPDARYRAFAQKYKEELAARKLRAREIFSKSSYTLVTAAKDVEHSHVPTLVAFLQILKIRTRRASPPRLTETPVSFSRPSTSLSCRR